jgi:ubiquinone/menaquinone biosynthesis C-methylase UbiE
MSRLDRIFAAAYDPVMARVERAGLASLRRQLLSTATGHVLELGAGTGTNLQHYPGGVERLTLLEPTGAMAARLRQQVSRDAPPHPVEVLEAPAEALPLDDASVDTVVSTLVLCTVEDPALALAEVRRVLRPDGRLLVLEHVAGDPAWLQRGLDPVWQIVGRGCHLRRDTAAALRAAGFDVTGLAEQPLPLPAPARPGLVGAARPLR